jgi:long-chain acyl-CoA synthetase
VNWVFDLDGTLIGSVRSDQLRPGTSALLDALAAQGIDCVLWSAGGADYARDKAREHGIEDRFVAFYAKASRDASARYTVDHFGDVHRPDVFVDDSPIDLPLDGNVVSVPQFIGGNASDRALLDVLGLLAAHGAGMKR